MMYAFMGELSYFRCRIVCCLLCCWACPGSKAAGSGYPLQVLGLMTGLRAFRFYPSRGVHNLFLVWGFRSWIHIWTVPIE